jgi:acyl carrier protein
MTLSCLRVTQRAPQEAFDSDKVRSLIADYLGIDAERVTDEAHFSEFGMDRYDRLELTILIEDALSQKCRLRSTARSLWSCGRTGAFGPYDAWGDARLESPLPLPVRQPQRCLPGRRH